VLGSSALSWRWHASVHRCSEPPITRPSGAW